MADQIAHIIRRSIKGDSRAQRELYERHRTRWYMISLRYAKSRMQAEDILQEGLIRIYRDLSQYDERRASFATWSSRVLVNAALRYLKQTSWMAISEISEAEYELESEEMILDHISAKELTQMIQRLPIGYRLVFNMYALEGYTHREIGEMLGISQGTSKSQLHKARKALQAELESQLKISRP